MPDDAGGPALHPAVALEGEVEHHRYYGHEREGEGVAEGSVSSGMWSKFMP